MSTASHLPSCSHCCWLTNIIGRCAIIKDTVVVFWWCVCACVWESESNRRYVILIWFFFIYAGAEWDTKISVPTHLLTSPHVTGVHSVYVEVLVDFEHDIVKVNIYCVCPMMNTVIQYVCWATHTDQSLVLQQPLQIFFPPSCRIPPKCVLQLLPVNAIHLSDKSFFCQCFVIYCAMVSAVSLGVFNLSWFCLHTTLLPVKVVDGMCSSGFLWALHQDFNTGGRYTMDNGFCLSASAATLFGWVWKCLFFVFTARH